ncbi:MAG: hypothetical protein LBM28_03320, partial [Oscillospiraceae bacterium]|nr:hypothetical protein [Oscillospiraceae bacterium]
MNLHRLSASLFGAFSLVLLALRQQGVVVRSKNPSKIASRQVRSSFRRANFRQVEKNAAVNT